jgi:hypothetical protein
MFVVSRPCGPTSLDGKEYLLDEVGKVKKFQRKKDVLELFKDLGLTNKEITEYLYIEKENK